MDKLIKKDHTESKNRSLERIFSDSAYFYFLHKKSEKISAAIYLVTNLIKDEDAIKWQLRKGSLDLVSDIIALYHLDLSDKKQVKKTQGLICELLSLFEIAYTAQVVSEMNAAVLRRELFALLDTIDGRAGDKGQSIAENNAPILSHDFFTVSQEQAEIYKRHSKRHESQDKMSFINPSIQNPQVKTKSDLFKDSKKESILEGISGIDNKAEPRRSVILSVFTSLKDKKDISIADLKGLIGGYSEKTIQRDLIALVKEGVLKKSGERRWSRYALA